jgi:hypothetical protein
VGFALRQLAARERLTRLAAFYAGASCHLARVHLLAAGALTLGRFSAHSPVFHAIGEELMPVDAASAPRTEDWARYARACQDGLPWPVRDELWIVAHARDMERVSVLGLEAAFALEAREHALDPTWRLLQQHVDFTLGTRLITGPVLAGMLPAETAMAESLARGMLRLVLTGWRFLAFFAFAFVRAVVAGEPTGPGDALSDRRAAGILLVNALLAVAAVRVYRRGVRSRERGRATREDDAWPLLSAVLGERVCSVHPLVLRFYANPARFETRAWLDLDGTLARLACRVATLLLGQGLHEDARGPFEARFRTFVRADGSMHFVRELSCDGTLRVFDSDFVVREAEGRPTLVEVFADLGLAVEMDVLPLEGGGLSIRGRRVRAHGLPLPSGGLAVEFRTRVVSGASAEELAIDGHLLVEPRTRIGRFLARVIGLPAELGCIHYRARPRALAARPATW